MFNIGDIVKIHAKYPDECEDGSFAKILDGTIARIKTKADRPLHYRHSPHIYNLEFIEIHSSNPDSIDIIAEDLNWRNEHLILVEKSTPIQELDTTILFTE